MTTMSFNMMTAFWRPIAALTFGLAAHGTSPSIHDSPCATRSDLIGPCFDLRGRVSIGNGNPNVRIWRVGTTRILGVVGAECDEHPCGPSAMPDSLWTQMDEDHDVFADLTVCPVTKERAGWMQMVCIDSARNTARRRR